MRKAGIALIGLVVLGGPSVAQQQALTLVKTTLPQVRIESVVSEPGAKSYRRTAQGRIIGVMSGRPATFTIAGLPAGARIAVVSPTDLPADKGNAVRSAPIATLCRATYFGQNREDSAGSVADASGRARITLNVSYVLPETGGSDTSLGPCSGMFAFTVIQPAPVQRPGLLSSPGRAAVVPGNLSNLQSLNRDGEHLFLMTPSYTPPPWTVYNYTNTYALRNVFNFIMKADGASSCSGTSLGPALYPIGPHQRNGDLALQVRSGPAGTICRAVSPGVALPEDVRITAIEWAVERDGEGCCVGDECMARVGENGVIAPGHLPSGLPDTYQGGAQTSIAPQLGVSQPALRTGQHMVGFAHAWMACDATAVNDKGVRLILKSVRFEGPANANLPRP